MPNRECGMRGVMLSEAAVTLSEAKDLFLRLRPLASLRVTTIPPSEFRIRRDYTGAAIIR